MKPVMKICGVRRVEDATLAVDLGASYVGCVLAGDSLRRASVEEVRRISAAVAGRARVVLVFRGESREEIMRAVDRTGIRRVQPHQTREPLARQLEAQGIVVHRVFALDPASRRLPLITPSPSEDRPALLDVGAGGSGTAFDWSLLEGGSPPSTFIAGGIAPENLASLLRYAPFGVDVSSGVEGAPGIKDPDRLRRLFAVLETQR
ncbi:MAG: phosphoribosylanthranilate isomerase [Planctomycetota bacterium]